jgi:drug/metabolite transporter (DMT)-like permease
MRSMYGHRSDDVRGIPVKGRVLIQYVLLALTWGSSFFFVSVGLQGLSPSQVVLARLTTGAIALVLACLVTRERLPRDPAVWLHLLIVGVLLCVLPFLLFAWAQQYVPSSVASILNATTPLMTMLVALVALPSERPNATRAAGLAVGFLGVLLVLAPWQDFAGSGAPIGQLACLGATASYGVAFVYLRRFVSPRGLAAVPVATVQVALASVVMLILTPFTAVEPFTLSPGIVWAMLALGVVGTGLAYVWNANIVREWGATPASTVTYLTPVVGVLLGTLGLGENLTWYQPLGAVVVIIGILLSQERLMPVVRGLRRKRENPSTRSDTYEI